VIVNEPDSMLQLCARDSQEYSARCRIQGIITAMPLISAALFDGPGLRTGRMLGQLVGADLVTKVVVTCPENQWASAITKVDSKKLSLTDIELISGPGLRRLLESIETEYLLIVLAGECVEFTSGALERMCTVARESGAGWLYSDYFDEAAGGLVNRPLIDYQRGSIRDNFNFGSVVLISTEAARRALELHGPIDESVKWGALYDLRLKISSRLRIVRLPEPMYTRVKSETGPAGQFDYVDPSQRLYQAEMERIATEHLKRAEVWLPPSFRQVDRDAANFPVKASIIIPVRNRVRTVADAVRSALSQTASFEFNVIVVDNHSTDGTTAILEQLAASDHRLIHLIPKARDLGIGGCWNEAIYSTHCGEIALQLDSDDLYKDHLTLRKITSKFDESSYAMVIGAYTIVDFDLNEIPPGLIDHQEWTRDNGRNNALRINGFGAPRAFYVPILRRIGFPNTSYGEDYAVGLRISREYEIGRLYESIYYARRWEGNSDAALDAAASNRYDSYKDWLRTVEMDARRRMLSE